MAVLCVFGAAGCGDLGAAPRDLPSRNRASIYGGTVEPSHDAVVALWAPEAACTATIIAKRAGQGFALTAAHCCDADEPQRMVIALGDDVSDEPTVFKVDRAARHPLFDSESYDFCMLTFSEAVGRQVSFQWLPTLPLLTPSDDAIAPGDSLDFIGYGVTETDFNNSERRHVSVEIDAVLKLSLEYNQGGGGPCFGDSGGPGLIASGGEARVAAVVSRGADDCAGKGVSGRVSAVYADFIAPYIGGAPFHATCADCDG